MRMLKKQNHQIKAIVPELDWQIGSSADSASKSWFPFDQDLRSHLNLQVSQRVLSLTKITRGTPRKGAGCCLPNIMLFCCMQAFKVRV